MSGHLFLASILVELFLWPPSELVFSLPTNVASLNCKCRLMNGLLWNKFAK